MRHAGKPMAVRLIGHAPLRTRLDKACGDATYQHQPPVKGLKHERTRTGVGGKKINTTVALKIARCAITGNFVDCPGAAPIQSLV